MSGATGLLCDEGIEKYGRRILQGWNRGGNGHLGDLHADKLGTHREVFSN